MNNAELINQMEETNKNLSELADTLEKQANSLPMKVLNWFVSCLTIVTFILCLYLLFVGSVAAGIVAGTIFLLIYFLRFTIAFTISIIAQHMKTQSTEISKDLKRYK